MEKEKKMYKLIISEKPSVAKSIADAVGAGTACDGYYEGNGYRVSWCYGHLIELATPEDYDEKYEKWNLADLPIIPEPWLYKIKEDTKAQYKVLRDLMHDNDIDSVVNACDAGREGENIFRHVYDMANCRKPMERLWISSMEESAVLDGMNSLRPGSDYDNLYMAALAREKADWLVGLNLTRNFTVLYGGKVLKIGRVQTPTLNMIVEREVEIQNFKKHKYYMVHLLANGMYVVTDKIDTEGDAENIASLCKGKSAKVVSYKSEHKKSAPPKLYDLTSLQMDASKIFGFTAKQTLDTTQALYEKKLVTYPRTDSKFLTHNEAGKVDEISEIICKKYSFICDAAFTPDTSNIINDKKVTDHHAIIPTVEIEKADIDKLSDKEKKILLLVITRIITATSVSLEYDSVKVEIECAGNTFKASGKTVTKQGYKKYEDALRTYFKASSDKEDKDNEDTVDQKIPAISEGDVLENTDTKVTEHFTKPPKRYTESTLLSQMEHAGEKDMDKDAERKGLGTTATRADIIEKIINQGYVRREKKTFVPTDAGMNLINILPDEIKSVQMTVDMENTLAGVSDGTVKDTDYLNQIIDFVSKVISMYSSVSAEEKSRFSTRELVGSCPFCGGDVLVGKYGIYCEKKCGMHFGRVMGKELTVNQWKNLLEGKRVLIKGLRSKKGTEYEAYFTAETVEDNNYTDKEGVKHFGKQLKFKMEFPEKKKGGTTK